MRRASAGLRHLSLKTNALEKTVRFYTDVLGLEVAFRVRPKRVFLRWPGQDDLLDFVASKGKIHPTGGLDHFGISVSRADLKRVERRLKENRVKIEGRRGRSSIYFRDPNRYWVEFYCD
ncbi:MAG TPA: VOC family protein [Candidatus Acidoferrales bacterium]|nr:VOC family protein [Candidatus Acidoferrales bacterium]